MRHNPTALATRRWGFETVDRSSVEETRVSGEVGDDTRPEDDSSTGLERGRFG
jgi:hypothetical protein